MDHSKEFRMLLLEAGIGTYVGNRSVVAGSYDTFSEEQARQVLKTILPTIREISHASRLTLGGSPGAYMVRSQRGQESDRCYKTPFQALANSWIVRDGLTFFIEDRKEFVMADAG